MQEKRPRLTDAERERIAELREKRWNIPSIAAAIGCSEGSVSWVLLIDGIDIHPGKPLPEVPILPVVYSRTGYVVRRFSQAEDAELLRLEASGLNLHQVGKLLGRKRNSIIGRLAILARRDARAESCAA